VTKYTMTSCQGQRGGPANRQALDSPQSLLVCRQAFNCRWWGRLPGRSSRLAASAFFFKCLGSCPMAMPSSPAPIAVMPKYTIVHLKYNDCRRTLLRSTWRRTARKAVLFAYSKSTLYPMTSGALSDILKRLGYYSAAECVRGETMNAASIYPVRLEHSKTRDSSISALSALARPASDEEQYESGEGKGLLSRMYPGLSREQAAAVVRQEIMVEQLRKVARSRKRRLHRSSSG